uniref:Bcl2 antagonist of cell death n=1 Tax=Oncorhynchus tshawytscha TaxID=74940 RepID=A0AAZ3NVG0_ONCTS
MDHIHDCVDECESDHSGTTHNSEFQLHVSTTMSNRPRPGERVRLYSESQVCSQVGKRENTEFQDVMTPTEDGGGDGASFRGRSQSAPPALWAAKKYGCQLRRMSDEFDTWLDKGEPKRGISPGGGKQKVSRGWFSFLWSPKEAEGRE